MDVGAERRGIGSLRLMTSATCGGIIFDEGCHHLGEADRAHFYWAA